MSEQINWAERRQFGRRPLNAEAVAELPGPVEIPCIIENLSEGGALLSFPTGVAPIDQFALSVENVPFRLQCEMRYQVGIRFGVRFKRLDQGEALVRHFFPPAAHTSTTHENRRAAAEHAASMTTSVRQLRQSMLPHILPEPIAVPAHLDTPKAVAPITSPAPLSSRPARITVKR